MGLGKQCYFCFREAIQVRHDTPRCLDHIPSMGELFKKETKPAEAKQVEEAPVTPRLPNLFEGWGGNWP